MENCKKLIPAEKQKYWQGQIEGWRKSGQSQAEYCRRKKITKSAFGYWRTRLARRVELVEIRPQPVKKERKKAVKPILKKFKEWMQVKKGQVPPTTKLGEAINYTLNQWKKLIRYLDAAFLTPDINIAENAIRPFVVGRNYAQFRIMLSNAA